ncbi:MAG: YceI family protein [Burkholderiales bacterium]
MHKIFIAAAVIAGLVSACVSSVPQPARDKQPVPAEFPQTHYVDAIERGEAIFRVDPALSLVVMEVRRSGSLARLGHDHVVASHDVQGYIAPDERRSNLYVELERLVVDEPDLRAQAGFETQPSAAFIAGTRQNMLEKVLEFERHPFALIRVQAIDADNDASRLNLSVTLHGVARSQQVPVEIEKTADEIGVSGRLTLTQSEFGITPFSILGGAIAVQDAVDVRFHIRARRVVSADENK